MGEKRFHRVWATRRIQRTLVAMSIYLVKPGQSLPTLLQVSDFHIALWGADKASVELAPAGRNERGINTKSASIGLIITLAPDPHKQKGQARAGETAQVLGSASIRT